jgi:hypothetical protein
VWRIAPPARSRRRRRPSTGAIEARGHGDAEAADRVGRRTAASTMPTASTSHADAQPKAHRAQPGDATNHASRPGDPSSRHAAEQCLDAPCVGEPADLHAADDDGPGSRGGLVKTARRRRPTQDWRKRASHGRRTDSGISRASADRTRSSSTAFRRGRPAEPSGSFADRQVGGSSAARRHHALDLRS